MVIRIKSKPTPLSYNKGLRQLSSLLQSRDPFLVSCAKSMLPLWKATHRFLRRSKKAQRTK